MVTLSVDLQALCRFCTPGLKIHPDLVGASHLFAVGGHGVKVTLPSLKKVENKEVLGLRSWHKVDGATVPFEYEVREIEVVVSIDDAQLLPASVMGVHPNAFDLIPERQQTHLNSLATSHYHLAERAMDRWARAMRWKTGNGQIARGSFEGMDTGWVTTLIDSVTRKRLWIHHEPMIVPFGSMVTPAQWDAASTCLTDGDESPVFVDILFDAEMHHKAGDLRRALVDAAVAAETYIRHVVQQALPIQLGESARQLIDRTSISQVTKNIFPDSLSQLGVSPINGETMNKIQQLFNARNAAMHKGQLASVNVENCSKWIDAVRHLLGTSIGSLQHGR